MTPVVARRTSPHDLRVELALMDERRFRNGVVFLRYRRR